MLFECHARGLRPTAQGKILCEFAVHIGNELDHARDEMLALRGGSGRVVIGVSGATIAGVVSQAVLSMLSTMPNASVEILERPWTGSFGN